jgi:hypothetical protein
VKAINACYPDGPSTCKNISLQSIPPTILPPVNICAEELPYTWPEAPFPTIASFGSFNLVSSPYPSHLGCDSIVQQTITVKQPIFVNLGTKYLCEGECLNVGNSNYCATGQYSHMLQSFQGCDSIVNFAIAVTPTSNIASIQSPFGKSITCNYPTLPLNSINYPNVLHLWTNNVGDTIGTGNTIVVGAPGFYSHQVSITNPDGTVCAAQTKVLIKENTAPPHVSAMGGTLDPITGTVQLMGHSIISGVIYSWQGPNGFTSGSRNPLVSVPGVYTLTVTNPQTGCSNSVSVEVTN